MAQGVFQQRHQRLAHAHGIAFHQQPGVQFLLQFEEPEIVENVEDATPPENPAPTSDGPKVVSLDQFRKK